MAADDSGTTSGTLDRVVPWTGPVAILVAAIGILAASVLAPWFSWTGNALSDLGARGVATAPLFNGTLIIAGFLGIPFAGWLVRVQRDRIRRAAAVVFGLSMPTLALIGVFALPSPLHGPVALAYFLLFTLAILVDGLGALRTGEARDGWLSIGLGTAHVAGWIVWGVSGHEGIALPEAVGTVAVGIWVLRRFQEFSGPGELLSPD